MAADDTPIWRDLHRDKDMQQIGHLDFDPGVPSAAAVDEDFNDDTGRGSTTDRMIGLVGSVLVGGLFLALVAVTFWGWLG